MYKALIKTRGLYRRWLELQDDNSTTVSKDEFEWTTTELRNSLRSIEWDLEDLEDTINILLFTLLYMQTSTPISLEIQLILFVLTIMYDARSINLLEKLSHCM